MRVEVIKSSGGYWYSTRTGEQFDVKEKHDNTYYVTVGDDVRHIHEFHCKVVEEKQEMKVGDKLKYKGGMNPEYGCYEDVTFDESYQVTRIGIDSVDLRIDNNFNWRFSLDEINSFFTEPVLVIQLDNHYDNTNGSLYKFAVDHNLNAFEFDAIKRLVRCRKKGQFREDLEKTIRVIELYLKEMEL